MMLKMTIFIGNLLEKA